MNVSEHLLVGIRRLRHRSCTFTYQQYLLSYHGGGNELRIKCYNKTMSGHLILEEGIPPPSKMGSMATRLYSFRSFTSFVWRASFHAGLTSLRHSATAFDISNHALLNFLRRRPIWILVGHICTLLSCAFFYTIRKLRLLEFFAKAYPSKFSMLYSLRRASFVKNNALHLCSRLVIFAQWSQKGCRRVTVTLSLQTFASTNQ